MSCPEYYKLANGTDFIDYQARRLTQFTGDLDAIETHCILSAAEHLFRKGRKPGTDRHDEDSQAWWLAQARNRYMERKRKEWSGVKAFPESKAQSRFDLIVGNIFGNTIAEKEKYLELMQGVK